MSKKDLFYGDVEGRMDATSNIGKPSYWASQPIRKMLTLAISIALFILLLIFMIVSYK